MKCVFAHVESLAEKHLGSKLDWACGHEMELIQIGGGGGCGSLPLVEGGSLFKEVKSINLCSAGPQVPGANNKYMQE